MNVLLSEYDALAKVIMQHPDRQETLRLVSYYWVCYSDAYFVNTVAVLFQLWFVNYSCCISITFSFQSFWHFSSLVL